MSDTTPVAPLRPALTRAWLADPTRQLGADGRARALSTPKERAEEKRREKLALIRKQLATGELTIRQMTPAERKQHPPRPDKPQRRQ